MGCSFNKPGWIDCNNIAHIMLVSGHKGMIDHPLRVNPVNKKHQDKNVWYLKEKGQVKKKENNIEHYLSFAIKI